MEELKKTVEQLKDYFTNEEMFKDLDKCISGERGAKSAAFRARRRTMLIEKLQKQFRKISCDVLK